MQPKKILIALIFFASVALSQNSFDAVTEKSAEAFETRKFEKLESVISLRVFLSVGNAYVGYYGSAQSINIISDYLSPLKFYSFKLVSKSQKDDLGYLSGKIYFSANTKRKTKEVFLTIKKLDGNWQITQITVN